MTPKASPLRCRRDTSRFNKSMIAPRFHSPVSGIVSRGKLQIIFGTNQGCLQIENPLSGTHPGAKFVYVKRLGQVIISARFQPCDHILFIILCCEQ